MFISRPFDVHLFATIDDIYVTNSRRMGSDFGDVIFTKGHFHWLMNVNEFSLVGGKPSFAALTRLY